MNIMKYRLTIFLSLISLLVKADDNYRLWLKYDKLPQQVVNQYIGINSVFVAGNSATLNVASQEIVLAMNGLLGKKIAKTANLSDGCIALIKSSDLEKYKLKAVVPSNPEGFIILSKIFGGKKITLISSQTDLGILYGTFTLLKKIQLHEPISQLNFSDQPKIKQRILNHWDNLDRTVERGYAGFSLWNWQTLPGYIDKRYIDYARANASIGINGTVLTNVNANALVLTHSWLLKVKSLADTFRPYGIKVYLTARFSAPIEIGGLKTADPLDPDVIKWWEEKTKEIYQLIPDFGGFLVKANSEGQPGPQNYGRNHADGANLLARALKPYQGIVMWRAFVYDQHVPEDRTKQAFSEFKPLDGQFESNVIIQVKNGALDFQPREPFHPLFGALEKTNTMMELQLTQEYLGMSTNLVYLGTLFKEVLEADTYAKGPKTTVGKVIDGSVYPYENTAIAGVANIGNDINWCGHPFAQSNWFAFGRLAWNHELSAKQIAKEWIDLSFKTDVKTTPIIQSLMMDSREAVVNYMTPLGLAHLMGWSHHYGPAPWIKDKLRADWTSVYYHQANKDGIGFNRTPSGSNATVQYFKPVADKFNDLATCPEEYLLWFHHLSWEYRLKSGDTLWDSIVKKYHYGTVQMDVAIKKWNGLSGKIDEDTFVQVKQLLEIQKEESIWWRDACVVYFQSFSGRPIPNSLFKPAHDLSYYQNLEFRYVPGIKDQN
jgi:alpha-glucuronidase